MKKDIVITLDEKSLLDASIEVLALAHHLDRAAEDTVQSLTEKGKTAAEIKLGVANGVLFKDIDVNIEAQYDEETNTGYVYSNDDDAVYLEYGTGFVGQNNPHPGIASGESTPPVMHHGSRTYTRYDTYEHGPDGWNFTDGGKTYHTAGWQGVQFMYDTYKVLQHLAPSEMRIAMQKRGVMK